MSSKRNQMGKKNIPNYEIPPSMPFILERIEDRPDKSINNPHRHEFYEIIWFKNDGGDHLIDFQPHPIKEDSIFFIAPGRVHQLNLESKKGFCWFLPKNSYIKIAFPEEDDFFNLFYSFDNVPFIQPSKEELYKIERLFELITLEYESELNDSIVLTAYLRAFLLHAQRIEQENG